MMKNQIKAARDLLGITQAQLCEAAGIPLITLRRVEGRPDHTGLVSEHVVESIVTTLEGMGVQFLEGGDVAAGPGVAITKGN